MKTILVIYAFLKELIFDTKDESDFKSHKFNSRKFLVFLFIAASITLNVVTIYRIVVLGDNLFQTQERNELLEKVWLDPGTPEQRKALLEKLSKQQDLVDKDKQGH